jgi:hypothetical protein
MQKILAQFTKTKSTSAAKNETVKKLSRIRTALFTIVGTKVQVEQFLIEVALWFRSPQHPEPRVPHSSHLPA